MMDKKEAAEVLIDFAMFNPPENTADRLVLADAIAAMGSKRSAEASKVAQAIRAADSAQLDFFRRP